MDEENSLGFYPRWARPVGEPRLDPPSEEHDRECPSFDGDPEAVCICPQLEMDAEDEAAEFRFEREREQKSS